MKKLESITDQKRKNEILARFEEKYIQKKKEYFKEFIKRYKELNSIDFIEMDVNYVDKLKQAVETYLESHYLSTIALCGILAEDIALDIFSSSQINVNNKQIGQDSKKEAFRILNQKYRLKFLMKLGLIDPKIYGKMDKIREIRNNHIHPKMSVSAKKDSLTTLNLLIDVIHKIYGKRYVPLEVFFRGSWP
jgi:hypothetical protein